MKNYYDILEIKENASQEVITAAYKSLVKKYHPDNCQGDKKKASQIFIEIQEAYEVLSDVNKRKEYDAQLRECCSSSNINKKQYMQEKYDEEDVPISNTPQKEDGLLMLILKSLGKSIVNSFEKLEMEYQNAYVEGLSLSDWVLVSRYTKATSYKKAGYMKAMEERGFFRRNAEGKLVPTVKLKDYWK